MAQLKRRLAQDTSQVIPEAKRTRSDRSAREATNFTPAFWDNLSKIWLTPRALRELDRRNNTHCLKHTPSDQVAPTDLARFARHGGPNLCHLRGYGQSHRTAVMSSNHSSTLSQSRHSDTTKASSISSKTRRSSAYDDDFEQHLLDHRIYPEGYEFPDDRSTPEPDNAAEIRQNLLIDRASLSPSQFDESAFREFKRKNKTKSEGTVMRAVIPIIAGGADIPNEGHLPFTNLQSLTEEATVKAVPDFFDGARPGSIDKTVSKSLSQMIIPTKHANVPAVPNFFLEAKASKGGADVALRQACYDGAYGARAIHSLQNYGEPAPKYDHKAHTFSSTYHDGTLKLFFHHIRASAPGEEQPEYHMTQIDGWQMTGNIDTFRRGATAFRNARDLAEQHRNCFIQDANARASGMGAAPGSVAKNAESVLLPDIPEEVTRTLDEQANTSNYSNGFAGKASSCSLPDGVSQDPEQLLVESDVDEPSMSFGSSITSVFSGDSSSTKRPKHSLSPSSKSAESRRPKSRIRPSIGPQHTAGLDDTGSGH